MTMSRADRLKNSNNYKSGEPFSAADAMRAMKSREEEKLTMSMAYTVLQRLVEQNYIIKQGDGRYCKARSTNLLRLRWDKNTLKQVIA